MKKICHITTVHTLYDTRIFYRECKTLQKAGYDVSLIASAEKDTFIDGIRIIALPRINNRFARIIFNPLIAFWKAFKLKPQIYHLHDPELIPLGAIFSIFGKKIIMDIHEDISAQIKVKKWLPMRNLTSKIFRIFDFIAAKTMHLILAENSYANLYSKYTNKYTTVLNMPDSDFFNKYYIDNRHEIPANELYYIGSITYDRGLDVILKALLILKSRKVNFKMHFIGDISNIINTTDFQNLTNEIKENIVFHGLLNLKEGYEISQQCKIGLAILKPIINYINSYPTKLFEYMAIGLPFITSNFPLYRNIIDKNKCGLYIDPNDPAELASTIEFLLINPEKAREMGRNGKKATSQEYNWAFESKKLLTVYKKIINTNN